MGLSIHYSGKFNQKASLKEMIDEVKDLAEAFNWNYKIFEKKFPEGSFNKKNFVPDNLYGIYFAPSQCEPVSIAFLSNGRMSSPINILAWGNDSNPEHEEYLYTVSVKTQFAGIDTHKIIIHLFKYLEKKYFSDFKMSDEGEYWETMDEKRLEEKFQEYNQILDDMSLALETIPKKEAESFEQYFQRLMDIIVKRK